MRRKRVVVGLVAVVVALVVGWAIRHRAAERTSGSAASAQKVVNRSTAAAPREPSKPASVSGRVTKKSDGSPIAGAVVCLSRAAAVDFGSEQHDSDIVVTSDATGAWTAARVDPGRYVVAATASGFLPGARDKVSVASGEPKTGVDLALEAGGTRVHGTISDLGGGTIADARVTFARQDFMGRHGGAFVAIAGTDGTYQLTLPDGPFVAAARHDDYSEETRDIEVAGKPLVVDFALTPGGIVRGRVIARDTGKPVPGARVEASSGRGSNEHGAGAKADGDGNFTLRSLHSGAISMTATGQGYASTAPTVVELGIGEQADDIQLLVDRAFSISGTVVKKASPAEGIAGVNVGAFAMATGQGGTAPDPTDSKGAFEIVGVRAGTFVLFALGDDHLPEIGKSVTVVDKDVTGVTLELATGASLSGRVEPAGVASVRLELVEEIGLANMFDAFKAMIVTAESDASGSFTLRNVPNGKFSIRASTQQGRVGKLAVTVTGVDQSGLVVALEQQGSIAGRVIDTNGAPVAAVQVRANATGDHKIEMMGPERPGTMTGADGGFRFTGLEPDKYAIAVEEEEEGPSDDKTKKPVEVELAKGQARDGVIVTVQAKDGVIRGQVVGLDHQATADAWVTATRSEASGDALEWAPASKPVLTAADGKFVISRLRRGTYTVVAEAARGTARGESKGIKTGDSTTITLAALGTLAVTVTSQGAPVRDYDLTCRGPGGEIARHASTADGSYTLEHLAPGSYACDVEAATGTANGKVEVPSGSATLALGLAPWASITGTVVSVVSGAPIPGIAAVVTGSNRAMMDVLTGAGPTTDASGRFTIERVPAGSGHISLYPKTSGFQELASKDYTVTAGQRLDLGTIKAVPPRTGESGTLGFTTAPRGKDLVVVSVTAGGPGAQAGIKEGDTILTVDGGKVADIGAEIASQYMSSGNVAAGQVVQLGLERGPVAVTAIKW